MQSSELADIVKSTIAGGGVVLLAATPVVAQQITSTNPNTTTKQETSISANQDRENVGNNSSSDGFAHGWRARYGADATIGFNHAPQLLFGSTSQYDLVDKRGAPAFVTRSALSQGFSLENRTRTMELTAGTILVHDDKLGQSLNFSDGAIDSATFPATGSVYLTADGKRAFFLDKERGILVGANVERVLGDMGQGQLPRNNISGSVGYVVGRLDDDHYVIALRLNSRNRVRQSDRVLGYTPNGVTSRTAARSDTVGRDLVPSVEVYGATGDKYLDQVRVRLSAEFPRGSTTITTIREDSSVPPEFRNVRVDYGRKPVLDGEVDMVIPIPPKFPFDLYYGIGYRLEMLTQLGSIPGASGKLINESSFSIRVGITNKIK